MKCIYLLTSNIVSPRRLLFGGVFANSSVPLGKFAAHTQENIGHGTDMWQEWFAGATATPFNTGCFCTVESCVDA